MNEKQNKQLQDFLDLVDEIEATPYWQNSRSRKISVSGKQGSMKMVDFDEQEFRAFLLTFRMLVQNNESTSIKNIYELIKKKEADSQRFAKVNGRRWMLNDFLDRQTWVVPGGGELSFREIKLTFLYGEYAHRDRKYRDRLDEWNKHNDQFAILKMNFTLAIKVIVESAIEMADAIRNPDKPIKTPRPPGTEGFVCRLQDWKSIRLIVAGIMDNEIARKALKRRLRLSREIHFFLHELGRNEGKGFSSLNAKTQEIQHPEGVIFGGDVGYRGAQITVQGIELDPDRSLQFSIGFQDDWRLIVKISSSELPDEFVSLEHSEPFDRVFEALKNHHGKIFNGWPLSESELQDQRLFQQDENS